jgi:hypothetical protein
MCYEDIKWARAARYREQLTAALTELSTPKPPGACPPQTSPTAAAIPTTSSRLAQPMVSTSDCTVATQEISRR